MFNMKIVLSSGTSTISNPGALKNAGPPAGLQPTSGGYRSTLEFRYCCKALAQGCNGTSAGRGAPPRPGRISQYPFLSEVDPKLTLPSGQRGVARSSAEGPADVAGCAWTDEGIADTEQTASETTAILKHVSLTGITS